MLPSRFHPADKRYIKFESRVYRQEVPVHSAWRTCFATRVNITPQYQATAERSDLSRPSSMWPCLARA